MTPQPPVLVTPPAAMPVTLPEVKQDMQIFHPDDDDLLQTYIAAAVAELDGWSGILGRCMITQTWSQTFDGFPEEDVIRLPFPDVSGVTVTYRDAANATQTLASSNYALAHDAVGSLIKLASGAEWPATFSRPDAVTVQLIAGFGASAASVPANLRIAMTKHVRQMWGRDGGAGPGSAFYDSLVGKFRRVPV